MIASAVANNVSIFDPEGMIRGHDVKAALRLKSRTEITWIDHRCCV